MRKLIILMVLTALSMSAQGKKASKLEQTVKDAEKGWADATIKGDEAALKKLLGDDLTYTHSNAETDSKQVYIDNLKNKVRTYHNIDYQNMEVRVYGTAAVLTASGKFDVTTRGTRSTSPLRFIHVWINNGGQWQLVAHQSTRIQ